MANWQFSVCLQRWLCVKIHSFFLMVPEQPMKNYNGNYIWAFIDEIYRQIYNAERRRQSRQMWWLSWCETGVSAWYIVDIEPHNIIVKGGQNYYLLLHSL